MTYDMNEPKEVAERMGIETYIEEISDWFHNTTEVTCKKIIILVYSFYKKAIRKLMFFYLCYNIFGDYYD